MNIIQYNPDLQIKNNALSISKKATELIKKFHQSSDGLTLKNWKALSEILDYAAEAEQTIADQKEYISNLESLASTDMLTGLLNRQGFENEIENAIARANRYGEISLFAFVDLDGFKRVNDTYGHNAGDAMLKRVGELLIKSVRQTDAASRLSGDEFGLLLSKCDVEKAKERAGYIRHYLKKITLNYHGNVLSTCASMGFAIIDRNVAMEEIFDIADKAMYENKRERKQTRNKYHLT